VGWRNLAWLMAIAELWWSGMLEGGPAAPAKKEEGEALSTMKQEREGVCGQRSSPEGRRMMTP
jgi:hypothetical protein